MLLDAGGFPGSELLHLCGIAWSIHVYVVVEEQEDLLAFSFSLDRFCYLLQKIFSIRRSLKHSIPGALKNFGLQ